MVADRRPRASGPDRLRILLVAPPMLPVPPLSYAGTERVVAAIGAELHRRGHAVALVAPGDSDVAYEHIPSVERSLWSAVPEADPAAGWTGDGTADDATSVAAAATAVAMERTIEVAALAANRFDLVHAHIEGHGFALAERCAVPVISTLHGRLDAPGLPELLERNQGAPLVAVSHSQRRFFPDQRWVGTIHNGLPLAGMPFREQPGDYLAFVGRVTPEKGIREALELSRRTGIRLRVAAKVLSEIEHRHFDEVVRPAMDAGELEFLGEVGPQERDPLYAGALATVMLGGWPEPFGLVAIESMATGTPVIARRAGALTETIEHGVTGFLVDDLGEAVLAAERVGGLDRRQIRELTLERFSPARMVDAYVEAYRAVLAAAGRPVQAAR